MPTSTADTGRAAAVHCPICATASTPAVNVPPAVYYGCPVCETLFQHPMPTIAQMQAYVDAEYQRGVYSDYVSAAGLKSLTFSRRAARLRARGAAGRLLDVGASCGYFVEQAQLAGFDAFGVELSPEAVQKAPPDVRARLSVGDVNALAMGGTTPFDTLTAFDLIEHVFDPIAFLTEIRSVARPGATIAITTPDARHLLRYVLGRRWPMFQPMQHTVLFSRRGLRLALERAGFDSVEIGPATKTLTADYLFGQIEMYLPFVVRAYRAAARILPRRLRTAPIDINIGELMAFARVPL